MTTDISPIFGLTLLEQIEWAVIATFVVAVVIGTTQGIQLYQQRQNQKHQAKIDSARLVWEMDKDFKTKELRDIHELVLAGDVDVTKGQHLAWLNRYLNVMLIAYKFYREGLISKTHIDYFYDGYLKILYGNDYVRPYIEKHEVFTYFGKRLQHLKKKGQVEDHHQC